MSFLDNPDSLRLLQNLLSPQQADGETDSIESDDDGPAPQNNITPANMQGITAAQPKAVKSKKESNKETAAEATELKPPNSIEEWQELQQKEDLAVLDQRKSPAYTMRYSQSIGTEDLYLQIGHRTPATASCENLVYEISMPDEAISSQAIGLTIKESEIDVSTRVYHLNLPLVHKVVVAKSHAKYDKEQRKLIITLRLQREFDFVNF